MHTRLWALLPFLLCAACISVGPGGEPAQVRWFRPELDNWSNTSSQQFPIPRNITIRADSHLGSKIAWRKDRTEYGFYELWRWTNDPVEFLEAATRLWPVPPSPSDQRTLELTLEAFEEDWGEDGRGAKVQIHAVLHLPGSGERAGFNSQSRLPVKGEGPIPLVQSLNQALQESLIQAMVWAHQHREPSMP